MSWSPECARVSPASFSKGKDYREVPLRQYIHTGRTAAAPHSIGSRDNSPSRCNTPSLTNGDSNRSPSLSSSRAFADPFSSEDHGCTAQPNLRFGGSWECSPTFVAAPNAGAGCANAGGPPAGDCDLSDDESESSEDNDDDWSGQESDAEPIVLAAVGNDLELAAHLIPLVHRMLAVEHTRDVDFKVGSWWSTMTAQPPRCPLGINVLDGSSPDGTSPAFTGQQSGGKPRKRQRLSGPSKDGQDPEDEDEGEDRDKDGGSDGCDEAGGVGPVMRLACPFHKFDPRKYGIQHEAVDAPKRPDYKSCSGPGFKNIQRLKEHLKRKHSPVQCERCYELFPGTDRSGCVLQLEAHRQLETSCERGDSALKEGISEAQWARLEGKRGNKNPQKVERVEKWYEIWDVLFPQRNPPASPWYDEEASNKRPKKVSAQTLSFMELYRNIMDHKVQHHDIDFSSSDMRDRIEAATQVTFNLWIAKHRVEASTNSSSSQPFQPSRLGGSSTHFSGQPSTSVLSYHPSHGSSGAHHSRTSSYAFQPPFSQHAVGAGNPTVTDPRFVAWPPAGPEYAGMAAVPSFPMHSRGTAPMEATFPRDAIHNWNPAGPFGNGSNFALTQGPTDFQGPATTGGIPNTFLEAPMDTMNEMDMTNPMTFHHSS